MTWENDARGKPCKWLKTIFITEEDWRDRNAEYEKKHAEIRATFTQCSAAVQELIATGEYVVIVSPEIVDHRDLEGMQYRYHIRARVRWLTPETKAIRERNLKAMGDAADDEFEKMLTMRGGHTSN